MIMGFTFSYFKELLRYFWLLLLGFVIHSPVFGQLNSEINIEVTGTPKNVVPFWMRSNKSGSIPMSGASTSVTLKTRKDFRNNSGDSTSKHNSPFDWGLGLEGRINTNGSSYDFILTEGYLKSRVGLLRLQAGRTTQTMGLVGDSTLTSGSFSISGNSFGIPNIEISVPNFYILPRTKKLIAIKFSVSHGWLAKTPIEDTIAVNPLNKLALLSLLNYSTPHFHQKSLYIQLGKPSWKIRALGGINHQVFWGEERKIYGNRFKLNEIETFKYVFLGKPYGGKNTDLPSSKIGNHLGSLDMAARLSLKKHEIMLYRQNFFDVGALFHLANLRDGLNGVVISWKKKVRKDLHLEKILIEALITKNQAGEVWSKHTPSGDEDYYNNYFYKNGWSYKELGLGTPFISTRSSVKKGQASHPDDYFINNRVIAIHFALRASIYDWHIMTKTSFSKNYGTFGTSSAGKSTGSNRYAPAFGIFTSVDQISLFSEIHAPAYRGTEFSLAIGVDRGALLENSIGASFKVAKRF